MRSDPRQGHGPRPAQTSPGANLTNALLSGSKLGGALNLTQGQIDCALPSAPPASLPEGIVWSYTKSGNEWILKPEAR